MNLLNREYEWAPIIRYRSGKNKKGKKKKDFLPLLPAMGHQNSRFSSLGTLGLSQRPQVPGSWRHTHIKPMTSLVLVFGPILSCATYIHRIPALDDLSQFHEPVLLMNSFLYVNFCVHVIGSAPVERERALTHTVVCIGARFQLRLRNFRDTTFVCLQAMKSLVDLGKPTPLYTELVFSYLQVTSGSHRKAPPRSYGLSEA